MNENNLFERLFLIQTKDSFELNNICMIQTKYHCEPNKYLFESNKFFFETNKLLH